MDVIDSTLVEALRADGRATWAELGRLVGLSGPSVQERVRRLEERGVITGYAAAVAPSAVGLSVSALIGLIQSDEALSEDVAAQLRWRSWWASCVGSAGWRGPARPSCSRRAGRGGRCRSPTRAPNLVT